ncbi:MAG: transporter substrate-binding domain-containing protein [Bacteroidetes bacterium]|nr:transporter substrate-binding domain-containing protein [Bacteroidota bacterium]
MDTTVMDALPNPVNRDLNQLRKDGNLVVLIGNSSSSYFIYRGRPMGFEYELLDMYAKSQGLYLDVKVLNDWNDAFAELNLGNCDLVAANMTVTKERSAVVSFTDYILTTRQVLVQRKPDGWEGMSFDAVRKHLIRNPIDLIGKMIHIREHTAYHRRLEHLSEELGGDIGMVLRSGTMETEELIRMVAEGIIDYTVSDEHIALLNASYYPNLDVGTPISFPQRMAWAVRANAPELKKSIDAWLAENRAKSDYNHLVMKYYRNQHSHKLRAGSGYHNQYGGRISIYDGYFKQYATAAGWDWRLIAAIAYQESKFNADLESWAGAKGLMQLLPETALRFGGDSVLNAESSIRAGVAFLSYLNRFWIKQIPDSAQRLPFVLASYNAGLGHVLDAVRLSVKYGNKAYDWKPVSYFLTHKNERRYYSDRVVKNGYCRGTEAVRYAHEIINRYGQYQRLIPLALGKEHMVASK